MKCTCGIFVLCVLALSALCRADPADVVKPKALEDYQIERDRRQAKAGNGSPQADVKTLGVQFGVAQGASQAQSAAGQFPIGAGNLQYNRYAGLMLGAGAYPGGPLNGGLGLAMGAGLPGLGGIGGGGAGYPGAGYPGAGFGYPGNLAAGAGAYNPLDPYSNYMYNGALPGNQLSNNLMSLPPSAQNLDSLVNFANLQGLQGLPSQMGNFQLQSQASQLQPQIAPYPIMSGYPQLGYNYQPYQGF